jgi:hypothetical protein
MEKSGEDANILNKSSLGSKIEVTLPMRKKNV